MHRALAYTDLYIAVFVCDVTVRKAKGIMLVMIMVA